jgi:hypothetical protein
MRVPSPPENRFQYRSVIVPPELPLEPDPQAATVAPTHAASEPDRKVRRVTVRLPGVS